MPSAIKFDNINNTRNRAILVLSRYDFQSITIDHDIVVTVLEIGGGKVRIDVEAAHDVNIVRFEFLKRQNNFFIAMNFMGRLNS